MTAEDNEIAAFFDLDNTVLDGSSGNLYGWKMYTEGLMSFRGLFVILWYTILYKTNRLPRRVVYRRVFDMMGRYHILEMIGFMDRNFDSIIAPRLYREAYEKVLEHKKLGHRTVIATAAGEYVAERVRAQLEVDDVIATPIPIDGERVTGESDGPTAFKEQKLQMARDYCAERGINLSNCYFYSDSASDLPLLEAVGNPVAVNPQRKLKRIAGSRGWPVLRFKEHAHFKKIARPSHMTTSNMEKFNRIYEESLLAGEAD